MYADAYCFFACPQDFHGATLGFSARAPVLFASCFGTRLSDLLAVTGCVSSELSAGFGGSVAGSPVGIGGNCPMCVRYVPFSSSATYASESNFTTFATGRSLLCASSARLGGSSSTLQCGIGTSCRPADTIMKPLSRRARLPLSPLRVVAFTPAISISQYATPFTSGR